jgi:hypothetical protein
VSSTRGRQSALLIALALIATAAVFVCGERTLPRALAGIALALLPWAAASRLEAVRLGDLPGARFAAAGGLALASLVLLGLVLTVTNIGLSEESAAVGAALITLGLTLAGNWGTADLTRAGRPQPLSLALFAVAVAIVVIAFAVARGGALDSARKGSGYAAFIVGEAGNQRLGLRNGTERSARFTVEIAGAGGSARTTLGVRPDQLRMVPVPRRSSGDIEIRVIVRVDGRRMGRPLTLSSSALS